MEQIIKKEQENKMGVMPVNKLLITMSLPMILSMLVQALYNVVDSIFVAQLSENALTAVSLAFPIQNLMIATTAGLSVGINALLSRSLGEKDQKKVNAAAAQGIFLELIGCVIFILIGFFVAEAFMHSQTDITEIAEMGTTYIRICCIFSIGVFGQFTFERLILSTGKTIYTMITQLIGAIINIILDPILIFGYFGMPAMGVAGAATATVIGQIAAATAAVIIHITRNKEIQVRFKGFKPDSKIIKALLIVGVPSIIMQSVGSIMNFGLNKILISFSSTAVAVFGVYFKLQSFVFLPVFGLNNGMVPIVAYNYGAKNKDRMMKVMKLSIIYAIGIMALGLIAMQLFPQTFLRMFNASDNMMEIGVVALRIVSLCFVLAGYCIITSSVFQALGNGIYSMILSFARQLIVLLPAAYIFSKIGGLNMVWWAFPAAELVSVILCTFFFRKIKKDIIDKLEITNT